MSFTPGPWKVGGENMPVTAVFSVDRQLIASTGGYSDHRRNALELAQEQEANARLIAAAPDLLEACRAGLLYEGARLGLARGRYLQRLHDDWLSKTGAAINKATKEEE